MSMYDNETKIYPDLNPSAPQEPQSYRLNKLSGIEEYLLNEIEVFEQNAKKMKRFNIITRIVSTVSYRINKPSHINSDHWKNFYCSIC